MPKVSVEHQEQRKKQILDAAMECFSSKGFHRTTMKDIVAASGLSPGAIYSYFGGKDDIIDAIASERHGREGALLRGETNSAGETIGLREIARAFFSDFASEDQKTMRRVGIEVWAEALRNPKILESVRRGVDQPREILADLVKEAQQRGEVSSSFDPEGLAMVMIAVFQGFVLQQAWDPQIDSARFLGAVESLVDLVSPSPET